MYDVVKQSKLGRLSSFSGVLTAMIYTEWWSSPSWEVKVICLRWLGYWACLWGQAQEYEVHWLSRSQVPHLNLHQWQGGQGLQVRRRALIRHNPGQKQRLSCIFLPAATDRGNHDIIKILSSSTKNMPDWLGAVSSSLNATINFRYYSRWGRCRNVALFTMISEMAEIYTLYMRDVTHHPLKYLKVCWTRQVSKLDQHASLVWTLQPSCGMSRQ